MGNRVEARTERREGERLPLTQPLAHLTRVRVRARARITSRVRGSYPNPP